MPGGRRLRRKRPALSVSVANSWFVSLLTALTDAPRTAAPWGSVTDPEMDPLLTCAFTGLAPKPIRAKVNTTIRAHVTPFTARFIAFSPVHIVFRIDKV